MWNIFHHRLVTVFICSFVLLMLKAVSTKEISKDKFSPMDMSGVSNEYRIYSPYHHIHSHRFGHSSGSAVRNPIPYVRPLITTPENWIQSLTARHHHLDHVTVNVTILPPAALRAMRAYLDMLGAFFLGHIYGRAEKSMLLDGSLRYTEYNATKREMGEDMSYLGITMVGGLRLQTLEDLIIKVTDYNISGDIVETGVWRGGCSTYALAVLRSYEQVLQLITDSSTVVSSIDAFNRRVLFCDSFAGLPPGDKQVHAGDVGWDGLSYISVSVEEVTQHIQEFNLMDPRIVYVKGFFNVSMPPLHEKYFVANNRQISVLRLDGDMYQSTVDVLYHLYAHVSIGGYIIVDDWDGFPAKDACEDFFRVHKMVVKIHRIDRYSIYFQKTEAIEVQYWRYQKKLFK